MALFGRGRATGGPGDDAALVFAPDSVSWLLNIRGTDIPKLPVVQSMALLETDGRVTLLVDPRRIPAGFAAHVGEGVTVQAEEEAAAVLGGFRGRTVLADPDTANAWSQLALERGGATLQAGGDPVLLPKACKNAVEIRGMRNAHIRDAVAEIRFLAWLDAEVAAGRLYTENELAERLHLDPMALRDKNDSHPARREERKRTAAAFGWSSRTAAGQGPRLGAGPVTALADGARAAQMLADRLAKNRRHLSKWAKREGVTCWRWYDRDIPDVPVTVPALDSTMCDGSTVDVQTAQLANQVVNAPGTALLVKMICDEKFDREFVILCAPDGTKVITQNVTPEDAPLGTAPVIEAWTLAGTAYTGDISLLTDCGAEKIDVTSAEWFCASGVPISRTDFWDVFSTPRALIGSLWQDVSGAVVPAPAAGSYVVGDCSCVSVPQGILVSWG